MFAANLAMASGNLKVTLTSSEADAAMVEISNTKNVHYEINLFDENGNRIYYMETETPREELRKRYDLSNLDDGNYLYTVEIDKEKVTKQLAIDRGEVEVLDIRKSVDPFFHQEGELLRLTYLNFENQVVKMYLYDENNAELLATELGNEFAIHKGIDLSKLRPGNYDLVLVSDHEIYQHDIELD